MTPQLLLGLGLAALVAGGGVLRTFGRRYRVGRLLASVTRVSIGDAVALARSGDRRFVRIDGRIDSDQEFEDADHRPLVLRRTHFEQRAGLLTGWRTLDLQVEAVPFQLDEGLDSIGIDQSALGVGLIVVPRRSVGLVGDLGDRVPVGANGPGPGTPARVTIEQVSSVEHAIAAGVPSLDASGTPLLTAGDGRPLILTTLELPEAMRILTGGAVGRSRLAAGLLAAGGGLLAIGVLWWLASAVFAPAVALAASPIPSVLPGADTRSSGQGPGLVGDPGLAILGVIAVALIAVLTTLAYVRFTNPREGA